MKQFNTILAPCQNPPLGVAPRMRVLPSLLVVGTSCLFFPLSARADQQGNGYAFNKLVVFDNTVTDRVTYHWHRVINVVPLDDGSRLRIVGSVAMPGQPSYVAAYAHDGSKLIALIRNRVDIYDLASPANPRLIRSFDLEEQGFKSPGGDLIQQIRDHTFILLTAGNTSELTLAGDDSEWRVRALALPTSAVRTGMSAEVSAFERPTETALVVRESGTFRYVIAWTEAHRPSVIAHRKYLRKIDDATGKVTSQLLLSVNLETID
jgi:hypothetical protein